jgi:hypothetical protein
MRYQASIRYSALPLIFVGVQAQRWSEERQDDPDLLDQLHGSSLSEVGRLALATGAVLAVR